MTTHKTSDDDDDDDDFSINRELLPAFTTNVSSQLVADLIEENNRPKKELSQAKTRIVELEDENDPPQKFSPTFISDELAKFLDKPVNSIVCFHEIQEKICDYIQENNLQPPKQNLIIPDAKLLTILKVEPNVQVTWFNLTRYINHNYSSISLDLPHKRFTPVLISDEFAEFMDKPVGSIVNIHEIVKKVDDYVKENNLHNKENRKIIPDAKLQKLIKPQDIDKLLYHNLQRYITHNYTHCPLLSSIPKTCNRPEYLLSSSYYSSSSLKPDSPEWMPSSSSSSS